MRPYESCVSVIDLFNTQPAATTNNLPSGWSIGMVLALFNAERWPSG